MPGHPDCSGWLQGLLLQQKDDTDQMSSIFHLMPNQIPTNIRTWGKNKFLRYWASSIPPRQACEQCVKVQLQNSLCFLKSVFFYNKTKGFVNCNEELKAEIWRGTISKLFPLKVGQGIKTGCIIKRFYKIFLPLSCLVTNPVCKSTFFPQYIGFKGMENKKQSDSVNDWFPKKKL